MLDLGEVRELAEVRVNGQNLGVVWTKPARVNITSAVKVGDNKLEVSIVNLWPNRLIGDAPLPRRSALPRRTCASLFPPHRCCLLACWDQFKFWLKKLGVNPPRRPRFPTNPSSNEISWQSNDSGHVSRTALPDRIRACRNLRRAGRMARRSSHRLPVRLRRSTARKSMACALAVRSSTGSRPLAAARSASPRKTCRIPSTSIKRRGSSPATRPQARVAMS